MSNPAGEFSLGNARGYIDIDPTGVRTGLEEAKQQLNSFRQDMSAWVTNTGRQVRDFGAAWTTASAPLAAALGAGINAAANFDETLIEIQARTGLTADAMDEVRSTALQLGADTVFSTQQAADAFLQLLTAGLDTEQALSTLPNVLAGAAAGGLDLGTSADIITNVMSAFNLTAEESNQIIEAMSRAAASSPANMLEIGEAMQRSGGMARTLGLDVERTSAIFSIFAQNGLRGSEAGTQLNSMLRNMSRQTPDTLGAWSDLGVSLFDSAGEMRDLDTVFNEIEASMANMTMEDQNRIATALAGSYGVLGFNALLASDGIGAMEETMSGQASAADVAQARMASFKGQINSMMGSVQALMITALTPFMNNVLLPIIARIIGVTNAVTTWATENEALTQMIVTLLAVIVGLGPVIMIVGQAMMFIGTAIGIILSPIGLLIAGVIALGVAFATNFMGIRDAVIGAIQQVISIFTDLTTAFQEGGFQGVADFVGNLVQNIITTIASMDWSQIATDILIGIGSALSTFTAWATWVYDNFIAPFISNIISVVQTTDWSQVATDIINAIGTVLLTLGTWATWIYDNILNPIVTNAATAIANIDWFSVGEGIINAIGFALTTTFDFIAWIIDSIFSPITTNTDAATGQVDWLGIGQSILNAIGSALILQFDFIIWMVDNVFAPLLAGAASAIGEFDWSTVGTNLMNSIANALPNIAQWVQDNIISPITNALSNFNPMESVNTAGNTASQIGQIGNAVASGDVSLSQLWGSIRNNLPSFDVGANFLPNDQVARVHAGEAIIPARFNPYNPNASSPLPLGNSGGMSVGDINFNIAQLGNISASEATRVGENLGEGILRKINANGGL